MTAFPIAAPGLAQSTTPSVPVRTPAWRLVIDGRDVSRDITPMVTAVTYEDVAHGASDSVEITIADLDGRWRNAWYPTKSDRVELWIGFEGEPLMPCGEFQIDQVEFEFPPDTVVIRGLATGVIPDLRTRRSVGFDGRTLLDIVTQVAKRHSFTVVGRIESIALPRVTQRNEDDLTFLTRIAEKYGYVFSLRGTQLVFFKVAQLSEVAPVVILTRTGVRRARLTDKVTGTYKAASFSYHDDKTNTTIAASVDAEGIAAGDTQQLQEIAAHSFAEAKAIARASLAAANRTEAKGTISLEGNALLVAATTVQLDASWAKLQGRYLVTKSSHKLTKREGYTVDASIERAIDESGDGPVDSTAFAFGGGSGTNRAF